MPSRPIWLTQGPVSPEGGCGTSWDAAVPAGREAESQVQKRGRHPLQLTPPGRPAPAAVFPSIALTCRPAAWGTQRSLFAAVAPSAGSRHSAPSVTRAFPARPHCRLHAPFQF